MLFFVVFAIVLAKAFNLLQLSYFLIVSQCTHMQAPEQNLYEKQKIPGNEEDLGKLQHIKQLADE